jgi:hypothetical protein
MGLSSPLIAIQVFQEDCGNDMRLNLVPIDSLRKSFILWRERRSVIQLRAGIAENIRSDLLGEDLLLTESHDSHPALPVQVLHAILSIEAAQLQQDWGAFSRT